MKAYRPSLGVFALGTVIVVSIPGCGKSGLVKRSHDSGALVVQDSRDAALPMVDAPVDLREAGRDSQRDIVRDIAQYMNRDVARDRPPEIRPDISPDGSGDTRPAIPPEGGQDSAVRPCTPFPTTTTLADLDDPAVFSTLLVVGDMLYVATSKMLGEGDEPRSSIVAISLSSRSSITYPLGMVMPAELAWGERALFYVQGKVTSIGPSMWSYTYPDVARLDVATGQVSVVDHTLLDSDNIRSPFATNTNGDVFWTLRSGEDSPNTIIRRWDREKGVAVTVLATDVTRPLLADADHLYWAGRASLGRIDVFSSPTSGGPVAPLVGVSVESSTWGGSLVAMDSQNFYFMQPNSFRGAILSIPKQGGNSRTLVKEATPLALGNRTHDDTHVYWSDYADPTRIRRVPKMGGEMETLPGGERESIADLVVDQCNLYWIDDRGYRVMARGK